MSNYSSHNRPTSTILDQEFDGRPGKNPFLTLAGAKKSDNTFSKSNVSPSSISGLSVTNIADGLAKFLVKRTKQELSITFFDKFKAELNSIPELKYLFPNTKVVLDAIGEEIYMYSNYLNSLREAFQKDLDIILESLDNYISTKHANTPNIAEPFSAGLFYANQIKNGVHPGDAAHKLTTRKNKVSEYKDEDFKKFMYTLQVLDIFSQSLRNNNGKDYWVSSSELNLLFDETTFRIYMGLLYQLHKDTKTGEGPNATFGSYLDSVNNLIGDFKEPISSFIRKTNELQLAISSIDSKKEKGEKIDSYFAVFSSAVKILGEGKDIASALGYTTKNKEIDPYLYVANLTGAIYTDINEKKYSALILDIVSLSDTLGFASKETQQKVLKYGTFIANVAQAENSDQVQAAIEAVALPVGSASIKRRTKFNIALNAYVGLSPGYEYIKSTDEWKWTFGINSPVGVAFSWGCYKEKSKCNCFKEKGSGSIFLSLVDIGAFSTYRFGDTETQELPEVTLSNVFAPGVYFVRGLPNVPVSVGLGGQLGPQLRKLTATDTETTTGLNASIKLFIAVDIPLINFYTKSR